MHIEICRRKHSKRKRKKSTFTTFSIIVSPFNGYIARFSGRFPQQFETNLIGFAIQTGGLRSGSGTLTSGSGFRSLHWKVKNESLKPRSCLLLKNYLLTSSLPVNSARMATILPSLLSFLFSVLQVQVFPCWRGGRGEKSQF